MVPTKYLTKIVGLALALHCNCLQAVHAAHAAADRGGGAAPADAIGIAIAAVAASTPKSWQVSLYTLDCHRVRLVLNTRSLPYT